MQNKDIAILARYSDNSALLFDPIAAKPFIAAHGFDEANMSWEQGDYFEDPIQAAMEADPKVVDAVIWREDDIQMAWKNKLSELGMDSAEIDNSLSSSEFLDFKETALQAFPGETLYREGMDVLNTAVYDAAYAYLDEQKEPETCR